MKILDELIELGQGPLRSLDCVIAISLHELPKNILERAQKAQIIFPQTAAHPIAINTFENLDDFTNKRLPHHDALELGIINNILALKMSHRLGDAMSMLLWLEAFFKETGENSPLILRSFSQKKDTPYRSLRNSETWMKNIIQSGNRKVETLTLHHGPTSFTVNDILILSLMRSLPEKRKGIWVPVNVRKNFWSGFGNGLSRMRIYPGNYTTREELQFIRKQKEEAFKNGEIALPPENLDLSSPIKKALFKCWLKRPWADWGTISLSHLEDRGNRFPYAKALFGITNLIEKHQAGLFAWTNQDSTYLTLTMDENVSSQEGNNLLNHIQHHFMEIQRELNPK